jgi:hypothetical protein
MDSKKEVNVKDVICEDFQNQVSQVLIRHKSVLDMMTKLDEYNARINRAVAKSVTLCGCISIDAKKQNFGDESFERMFDKAETHVKGELCGSCKDVLQEEIGSYLFYLTSLCNTLVVDLQESIEKEYDRIKTLGIYSLK